MSGNKEQKDKKIAAALVMHIETGVLYEACIEEPPKGFYERVFTLESNNTRRQMYSLYGGLSFLRNHFVYIGEV